MKQNQEAIERARTLFKPGDTLYTILRHVSRSGMRREISVIQMLTPTDVREWDRLISKVLGWPMGERGIKVNGCGMDMGFELVYQLGRVLFPDGFGELGKHGAGAVRPESKAEAERLVAKGAKFRGRNGDPSGWDNDGGYALKQRWL